MVQCQNEEHSHDGTAEHGLAGNTPPPHTGICIVQKEMPGDRENGITRTADEQGGLEPCTRFFTIGSDKPGEKESQRTEAVPEPEQLGSVYAAGVVPPRYSGGGPEN